MINKIMNFIKLFLKKSEKVIEEQTKEDYYNSKYPTQNVLYRRTDKFGKLNIDVRQFINPRNFALPIIDGEVDDEKALNSLNWVRNNLKYVSDSKQFGLPEYWAFSYETLNRKKDDCEGGAILLTNIMLKNGIPNWKIRVNCGNVQNPYTKKLEGHAYVSYYCEESDKWVLLDWCYLPNSLDISNRKNYKDENIYKDIWFSFNEENAYGRDADLRKAKKFLNN